MHSWTASWARYCPRCGKEGFDSVDGRKHTCARCDFQYYHNLAAAVCAILRCGDDIALVVRARDPGRGLLDFPGGFVDPAEDLETAVLREVREEIGLELAAPRYLYSVPNVYRYREVDYWTLDAMFEFTLTRRPVFTLNDEILDVQWWAPVAIDPTAVAFASVRSAIRRLCQGRVGD